MPDDEPYITVMRNTPGTKFFAVLLNYEQEQWVIKRTNPEFHSLDEARADAKKWALRLKLEYR
jgi:hypothetical protein